MGGLGALEPTDVYVHVASKGTMRYWLSRFTLDDDIT